MPGGLSGRKNYCFDFLVDLFTVFDNSSVLDYDAFTRCIGNWNTLDLRSRGGGRHASASCRMAVKNGAIRRIVRAYPPPQYRKVIFLHEISLI